MRFKPNSESEHETTEKPSFGANANRLDLQSLVIILVFQLYLQNLQSVTELVTLMRDDVLMCLKNSVTLKVSSNLPEYTWITIYKRQLFVSSSSP